MNTDEAFMTLAKAYAIPEQIFRAQVGAIRGSNGTSVSNLALVTWLREQAQSYERGMGSYGHPVAIETLSKVALYRLCAERLEKCNLDSFMLDHINRCAERQKDGSWKLTYPEAGEDDSLKSAAKTDALQPVAMA